MVSWNWELLCVKRAHGEEQKGPYLANDAITSLTDTLTRYHCDSNFLLLLPEHFGYTLSGISVRGQPRTYCFASSPPVSSRKALGTEQTFLFRAHVTSSIRTPPTGGRCYQTPEFSKTLGGKDTKASESEEV